jgi:hypothetical protein
MKNIKFLAMLVLATSVAMISCKDDEKKPTPSKKPTVAGKVYVGTLSLATATPFVLDDVEVQILETEYADSVQVVLKQVKFSERMPRMDITIPSVYAVAAIDVNTPNAYRLSGNNIIPTATGGIPAPDPYKPITDLQGLASDASLSLSMIVGVLPLSFESIITVVVR